MTSQEITKQLDAIANSEDFIPLAYQLTDAWAGASAGIETVEPLLRFIEEHPSIDYGAPGPLVHYLEDFLGKGYEQKLLESIERHPTSETVGMLHRLINGAKNNAVRRHLLAVMERARFNPRADEDTVQRASHYLVYHGA